MKKSPDLLTIEKVQAQKKHKHQNHLIHETSPYLLQHAHNPVNWYAWSEEAFEKARSENKPVLLSIGYSTCHWCHVMEHESFEDEEIAKVMNERYISIKVDREQRPDVDSVYMNVVQSLTGHGGWPMTVWLTPDKAPFYAGTYFPARDGDRGGHPGFMQLLERLSMIYQANPKEVSNKADEIVQYISSNAQQMQSGGLPQPKVFDRGFAEFNRMFDPRYGGFGFAPKFPRPSTLQFLLHQYHRTQDPQALEVVTKTLKGMLNGGIYDQLGGGFHRYSVDTYWLVPHFEKMLYDQSQIVMSMLDAFQITKDPELERGVRETLDYVIREMTNAEGGFYSATDADSEGEEGKFFVWSFEELEKSIDSSRKSEFLEYYGATLEGNFEGHNILCIQESVAEFAKKKSIDPTELKQEFEKIKQHLFEIRAKRIPPLTDDKVIAAWNGLMIAAFARAGFILHHQAYLDVAIRSAEFIMQKLVVGDELHRSFRNGKCNTKAFLDDYACMIFGLLELFETTGDTRWLDQAKVFQNQMIQKFWDHAKGGFFATADQTLFTREKPFYDGAEPSGNSIAAWNLLRLSSLTKDESYRGLAEKIFQIFAEVIENNPTYLPQMLVALDYYHAKSKEIVIVQGASGNFTAMLDAIRSTYLPNRVLIQAHAKNLADLKGLPSMEEKLQVSQATAYVCEGFVCQAPALDAETFRKQLTA